MVKQKTRICILFHSTQNLYNTNYKNSKNKPLMIIRVNYYNNNVNVGLNNHARGNTCQNLGRSSNVYLIGDPATKGFD